MENSIFERLKLSKFRSSFKLRLKQIKYIQKKGLDTIKDHAYAFVNARLRDTSHICDGKQTPMKGHPVFIAQHATATCCRKCLEKWHHIKRDHILTPSEVEYIVSVIMTWIRSQMEKETKY